MAVRTNLGAGTRLASYTISELLGRGAMGVVYEAHDARLGRRVALKVLAPSIGESERFRERFLRESRIAASIDHPNVIPIYEAGEAGGLLYIAMRRVVGTDLRGLLAAEGPLAPERALRIVEQAASALDAAHAAGLLHRDVKPGNILLATDETTREHVYLSDFGLAVSGSADGMLDGGSFHGTAGYAAPEQIEGRPEARSDVYSLACVLYECLAGTPPFGSRRLLAALWAHLNEEPARLSEHCSRCPEEADEAMAAALAKSPGERPATCGALASTMRAALKLEPRPRRRRLTAALGVVAVGGLGLALATGLIPGLVGPAKTEAPVISTFAGNGNRGSGGDGGPARRAELGEPLSVAADRTGDVYVGEAISYRVRRIAPDGTIRAFAGNGRRGQSGDGGAAVEAEIAVPADLEVGPRGDLYILQHELPAVRRVDGRGVITTVAGTGEAGILEDDGRTSSPNLCGSPVDIALSPAGALHVACLNAHRVIRVEPDGSFTTVAGSRESGYGGDGGRATEAKLNGPSSIAFDSAGNLYVAEQAGHRVRKVDRRGIITTFAGTGRPGVSGDGFRASFVDLWSPVRLDVDAEDSVYILELAVSRIRKVDGRGILTTVAGTGKAGFSGDGGPATNAELGSPLGFAVDAEGNLFIADRGNDRLRKVTPGEE